MKIPNVIHDEFSWPMQISVEAIVAAGLEIRHLPRSFEVKKGEGQRSGITAGDKRSTQILVERLLHRFPDAKILSEEDHLHPNMLPKDSPKGLFDRGLRFVIDGVDSTLQYANDMGGWSVTAGVIENGLVTGSAVFAPATNNGLLVFAEYGKGTWIANWGSREARLIAPSRLPTPRNESTVLVGIDPLLYPSVNGILDTIGANTKGLLTSGSGALGLALVASGQAQVILNTPQKAWDWAVAYRAMLEAGKIFNFFRLVEDAESHTNPKKQTRKLVPLPDYVHSAFATTKDNQNRLGFAAGEPELADWIMSLLPSTGWARTNPDTAGASQVDLTSRLRSNGSP